jgi:hypothetical protein
MAPPASPRSHRGRRSDERSTIRAWEDAGNTAAQADASIAAAEVPSTMVTPLAPPRSPRWHRSDERSAFRSGEDAGNTAAQADAVIAARAAAAELRSTQEALEDVTHQLNCTIHALSLLEEEYHEMMILFWRRVLSLVRDQPPNVRVSNEDMAEILHRAGIPSYCLDQLIRWSNQSEN